MWSSARWISSPLNWELIRRKFAAKNFPAADEFPFTPPPVSITTAATTKPRSIKRRRFIGYAALARSSRRKRALTGDLLGIGVSTYVEICALGPSQAMPAGGWESATVRIEPTGKVTVLDRRLAARPGTGDFFRADCRRRTRRRS